MKIEIQKITTEQRDLFESLSQDYELDFAPLTGANTP